jgi:acetyl esterase/lipase
MTQTHQQICPQRATCPWLVFTITAAAFWCQLTQSALARRVPEEVTDTTVQRDLVYKRVDSMELRLDLYSPRKISAPLPVIIWIHGGSWYRGRKERCPAVRMVDEGYAVASIDYRLTEVAPFPAQIEDCKAAVRWLRANASKYNLDPNRIGVCGFSAGGHLAALLGTSGGVRELEGGGDNLNVSSRVQAVLVVSGPVDFVRLYHDALTTPTETTPKVLAAIKALMGGSIEEHEATAIAASPLNYISRDDPPFLIIHGEQDATVPVIQCHLLADALKRAGVETTLDIASGRGHGVAVRKFDSVITAFFSKNLKQSQRSNLTSRY